MPNDAAVTVRLPAPLKKRLEARARENHRSLSAQVLHDLDAAASAGPDSTKTGGFLGLFVGSRVPAEADIRDVRRRLWGRLTARRVRSDD